MGKKVGLRGEKYLWLQVSDDEYEWPLLICDSLEELAEVTGITESTIRTSVFRVEKGKQKFSRYRRVPKDYESNEVNDLIGYQKERSGAECLIVEHGEL